MATTSVNRMMVSSSTLSLMLIATIAANAVADSTFSPGGGNCTFQDHTGFDKGQQVPGHRNDPAATPQACCDLCFAIQGCSGASYGNGQCYYKTIKEMKPRPLATATAVFGTWAPQPPGPAPKPPPPPAACGTFTSKDTCPAKRCTWSGSACTSPPPPPPPPPAPPLPPAPAPITPSKCPPGDKPVQVFIMMGQSNMLGEGFKTGKSNNSLENAVQNDGKYQYLWDKATGNYSVSKNVRNVFVMGSGGEAATIDLFHNEFMTAGMTTPATQPGMVSRSKDTIGPELGIGFALGNYTTEPVMTLKSCIGDRALGWDLLPPGSKGFNYNNYTYAGYHESPAKWPQGGPKPPGISWAAGIQYDGDITRANNVLANLTKFYPGTSCYEVAGFFWWQGDRDSRDMGYSTEYETNLVSLIKALRVQYSSPNAKFVTATLGQTVKGDTSGGGLILDAMENVADATKYPDFKGNVAAVYTHPLMHSPGSSGGHYGKDANSYMNVGQAMGEAMVGLLKGDNQ